MVTIERISFSVLVKFEGQKFGHREKRLTKFFPKCSSVENRVSPLVTGPDLTENRSVDNEWRWRNELEW